MPEKTAPLEVLPDDKAMAFETARRLLEDDHFKVIGFDKDRPWGFFLTVNEAQAQEFIERFFKGVDLGQMDLSLPLQPKLLGIAPGLRLSWQWHHRRSEIWRNQGGQFDFVSSKTDEETESRKIGLGEVVFIPQGVRHRAKGGIGWSIVSEIWQHEDPTNQSDEDDIVRVQDDFARGTPRL